MKGIPVKILLFACAVAIYSCDTQDCNMYTRINPDGSCYREFVINTDSAYFAGDTSKKPFLMKIDSSWNVTKLKKTADDTMWFQRYPRYIQYKHGNSSLYYYARAEKNFHTVRELAETFRFNDSDWDSVIPRPEYQKHFRWFYSYHTFSETYPKVNPLKLVPIADFLSDEEVETWFGENKELYKGKNGVEINEMLDQLENKVDNWLEKSIYEEYYRLYLKYFTQFRDMPMDSATFAREKDTVYRFIKDSRDKEGSEFPFDDLEAALDTYFHTDAFSKNIKGEMSERMENELPDFMRFFGIELNYNLSMPGKIIETNAPFIEGDTLIWRVEAYRFFMKDYTLHAESRKPNYGAFVLTGILIGASVLGFWVRKKQ